MARKYGKQVEVVIDPLAYNIGIIGESGIGKSTLVKEVCEELAGPEGYLALDVGKEDGHGAIQGIVSEPIESWAKFDEVTTDIIDNRLTDYGSLKVIIIDTYDQLMELAEKEVVRLHNMQEMKKDNPKRIDSVNAAFGGFQAGQDKAIEIVLDRLWKLKSVGVHFFIIGHTKKRDVDDPILNQSYSILTTNMSQKYFTAIKTKLHVLGVTYIDRSIVRQSTGKTNIVTGVAEKKGVIQSETRKISFRDDNFSIDSKSRFKEIINEIPLDKTAFIDALKDAILKEHSKSGKTAAEASKEQEATAKKRVAANCDKLQANKIDLQENDRLIKLIQEHYPTAGEASRNRVRVIMDENNIPNFKDNNIPTSVLKDIVGVLMPE